jgi:peptide/nickel transport system substrate-binding protein
VEEIMARADRTAGWPYRRSRRRFLMTAATSMSAILAGSGWLVACGRESGTTTSPPSAASTTTAPAAAATPKRGGTLRLPIIFTNGHFDIHQFQTGYQMAIWRSCANGLFTIDPTTGEPVGDLAKTWEFPDLTTFVVKLHPNATWQRKAPVNGRAVTAQDVKFSLERIATRSPDFTRSSDYALVDRIEAPDNQTVKIVLKRPFVPLISMLANFQAVIVAPEVVQQFGDLKKPEAIIGSGPFQAERADSSTGARCVRNPDYWEPGLPYLDAIEWTIVNDVQTSLAAFRAGKFHLHDIEAIDVASFGGDKAITIEKFFSPQYFVQGLGGPIDRAPLNDPRVRQALDLTIDREALGRVGYPGAQFTLSSVFAHPAWSLPTEEVVKRPGFRSPKDQDLAEAQKLVSAAGGSIPLTITTSPQYASFYLDRAQVYKAQLEKVGFKVELDLNEYAAFKEKERGKRFQLTTGTWAFQNDPDAVLSGAFGAEGARNYFSYASPQFEALIEKERAEIDGAKRRAVVHDAQRLLLDDRPLAFTAWFLTATIGRRTEVRGARFGGTQPTGTNAGEQAYQSKSIWLDQ